MPQISSLETPRHWSKRLSWLVLSKTKFQRAIWRQLLRACPCHPARNSLQSAKDPPASGGKGWEQHVMCDKALAFPVKEPSSSVGYWPMESASRTVLHFSSVMSQHRLKEDTFPVLVVPGDDWAWACPCLGKDLPWFVCCPSTHRCDWVLSCSTL